MTYDGGEPREVLRWESTAGANHKPAAPNERVIVELDNPEGAKSAVLTFELADAANDWYWAIDNLRLTGRPLR